MGASPRTVITQKGCPTPKGLSKPVRPPQGRMSPNASRSVGFTHGHSRCSPSGSKATNAELDSFARRSGLQNSELTLRGATQCPTLLSGKKTQTTSISITRTGARDSRLSLAMFGALSTVGQVLAYRAGIRPTIDYQPAARPRLTKHQFLAAVNRTVGYAVAGYISALTSHQRANALGVGVKAGLVIGVVTAVASACTSFIEWSADRVPEKLMGAFGVGLILIGFALQSVQYWLVLLDVGIRS